MQAFFPSHRHAIGIPWLRHLLLAVSLVLAQLLFAEHEVHHITGDDNEDICEICAIGGGLNQARTADSPTFPLILPKRPSSRPALVLPPALCLPGRRARGPPSPGNLV